MGTAVALTIAEVAVRWIAPRPTELQSPGMYVPDVSVGYRLNPGHAGFLGNRVEYHTSVHVNSDGLRGEMTGPVDCRLRVLVIGDSFVFGQGVEASDAFPAKLQAALRTRGIASQVMNAGVRGYGTAQEVAWLRTYGMMLSPDIVVMGVFLGNDIQDNMLAPAAHRAIPAELARTSGKWWHNGLTQWLFGNSHLYVLLRDVPRHWKMHRTSIGRVDVAYLSKTYPAAAVTEDTEAMRRTATAVEEFARMTREAGVEQLAVLIPDALQVGPWRSDLAKELAGKGIRLDFDYPRRIFTDLFAGHGVAVLDLSGTLRDSVAGGKVLYYPVDGHWTPLGHDVAASTVADFVQAGVQVRSLLDRAGRGPVAGGLWRSSPCAGGPS